MRISPQSIQSADQAQRIIRQLMVLRATGMAPYRMVHDNAFREKEEIKNEVILMTQPEKRFKAGACTASIFVNEVQTIEDREGAERCSATDVQGEGRLVPADRELQCK